MHIHDDEERKLHGHPRKCRFSTLTDDDDDDVREVSRARMRTGLWRHVLARSELIIESIGLFRESLPAVRLSSLFSRPIEVLYIGEGDCERERTSAFLDVQVRCNAENRRAMLRRKRNFAISMPVRTSICL